MRDHYNYPTMVDAALRGVVRSVLKRVQEQGLRGNHHLYLSFLTHFPGVVVADYLRSKYPKEMTIVLQHQYWDLDVTDEGFDLTLSFHKIPERLTIPFAAMTGFADPSEKRVLQAGMVIAIEPFLSTRARMAEDTGDGWTLSGGPGNLSAQFEHTLIVTHGAPIVLTRH